MASSSSSDLEGSLLGVCNPLLDLSAEVDHAFLEKYGLKSGNAILAEDKHLPLYEELVKNYKVQYIAGGAGQNSIRAAQWMLQVPKATGYVGCIGKDHNGKILRDEATSDGVTVHYLEDPTTPTGTCAVLVTNKERSLVAYLGAANCYKKSVHYDTEEMQAVLRKVKVIYATGFFITVSYETLLAMAQYAAEHNKVFALNISAPFVVDFYTEQFSTLLKYADIVFGNEHEYEALGKKLNFGEDLSQVAQKVAELPKENQNRKRVVIVTQGAKNTIIVHDGKTVSLTPLKVAPEEIVDLNGAGDSFVGGFLAAYVKDHPLEKCVEAGHYCASETIKVSGTVFKGRVPTFTL